MKKVFVFAIDGAPPEYIFEKWLDELPNIKKLIKNGCKALLKSTIPPLSGTAWSSITTGKSPSDTGIFEYVYRKNYTYNFHLISSKSIQEKTVWKIASDSGKKSAVCFIPITWPIKPFNGSLVSGFMTPPDVESVYPKELLEELRKIIKEDLEFFVPDFRHLSEDELIKKIYKTTEVHFKVMEHIFKNKEWDLFFGLINSSDTLNHTFWKYIDEKHRKYVPNSKYKNVLKEYYKFLDKKLGEFLGLLGDATVIVLSDHGMKRMHSRVNLTDWLIQNNYMTLKEPVKEKCEFDFKMVDWEKTKAFAIGAYDGQIFVNVKGREPEGIIDKEDYDSILDELERKLKEVTGDRGERLNTICYKKKDYFKGKCDDRAPDMIVYFDDLQYGCNNSIIGNETLWNPATKKGSDDSIHSKQGIFIMKNGKCKGDIGEIDSLDITPTILKELGLKIPEDLTGKAVDVTNKYLN